MTEKQKEFHKRNKYRKTPIGRCVICGKPSKWNEDKGHYERFCSEKCKNAYVALRNARVAEKYGTSNLADIAEFQRDKLMAGRTIAKPYTHTDGTVYNVLSKLEYNTLEFLDKKMHLSSDDIEAPMTSDNIKYKFHGVSKTHYPDIYIKSMNLIISIKDGLDNPNKHPNFKKDREKNIAIYKSILKNYKYNYMQLEGKEVTIISDMIKCAYYVIGKDSRFVLPPRIDFVMYNESCTRPNEELSRYFHIVIPKSTEYNVLETVFLSRGILYDKQLYTIYKNGIVAIHNLNDIKEDYIVRDISKFNLKYEDFVNYMETNNIDDMFHAVIGILGFPIDDPESTLQEGFEYLIEKTDKYIPLQEDLSDMLNLKEVLPL